jgi:eukaryotic-like serine/threonine-protein kinase
MSTEGQQRFEELYEFGPFRMDAGRETLLKAGVPVPLTPKTFQILLVLVRHGREVVTKDDLLKTVWPDTFVEEANLSRNIFMLRKALGETAQDSRYVVTVPGRGYRLAEHVHSVPGQDFAMTAASHSRVEIEVEESQPRRRKVVILVAVVAMSFFLVAVLGRSLFLRRPVLGATDTVVLGDFKNSTGKPVFDEALREGLAIGLRQSPYLSLLSDQRISHTERLMGLKPGGRLTPEIARGICERTGSTATLAGSIAPLGSHYLLTLEAQSCRTGQVLVEEQAQAAGDEDVLHALDELAGRFRQKVGESLATIQEHNVPLAEATTSSLEALEAYSAGWKLHQVSGAMTSLPLMKRAVEIDPDFALAQTMLARSFASLDQQDLAAASATRAWQARARASEQERFFIVANYEGLATGNLALAQQNDEAWARAYPRDPVPHGLLSGLPNKAAARFQQAIGHAQQAIELDPDFGIAYYNLAVNHVYLGDLQEAENVLRRATGRGLQIDEFVMLQHDLAFLRHDRAGMDQAAALARERSGGDAWISNKEAYALAYVGQLKQARFTSQRALDQAIQENQPERAGLWQAGAALREAFFGEEMLAQKNAKAALAFSTNREVQFGAALALAMTRSVATAQSLADDLEKRFPEDTIVRFNSVPVVRAHIAIEEGNPAKAIDLLEVTRPYELGANRLLFGALYPIYERGQAYLAARQGMEAAVEFRRILNHPGVVGSDPIGALARLQLGRALVLTGDRGGAKAAYQEFLNLWSNADQNVPILQQAKAEYAALR